jgi:hypothetical protein
MYVGRIVGICHFDTAFAVPSEANPCQLKAEICRRKSVKTSMSTNSMLILFDVKTVCISFSPMKIKVLSWFLCSASLLVSGCASTQVHWDATRLREAALDYYTDQVMDNLIRGKNGQLILHVDITILTAQVTTKVAGSVGGGKTTANTANRGAAGLLTSTANVTTKPFTFSISPERDDQLTITSVPEINDSAVYQLYLQFLNLPAFTNTTSFSATVLGSLPSSGLNVAHSDNIFSVQQRRHGEDLKDGDYVAGTLRTWAGHQYYVPIGYKQQYFDLCMGLVSRIKLKTPAPDAKRLAPAEFLAPKYYDSPELRLLQQLQQKIETLSQP